VDCRGRDNLPNEGQHLLVPSPRDRLTVRLIPRAVIHDPRRRRRARRNEKADDEQNPNNTSRAAMEDRVAFAWQRPDGPPR
jgi:hypothetical protein